MAMSRQMIEQVSYANLHKGIMGYKMTFHSNPNQKNI